MRWTFSDSNAAGFAADYARGDAWLFRHGILLTDFLLEQRQKAWNALTALLGVFFSGVSLWNAGPAGVDGTAGFNDAIVIDPFFIFFGFIFLAATALVILLSVRYLEIEDEHHGEYYALMLFASVGMMFLACGNDLVDAISWPSRRWPSAFMC